MRWPGEPLPSRARRADRLTGRPLGRPFPLLTLIGACFVMSAWLPWIVAVAVLVVLPIALRLFVGDDPPSNQIAQEQPGDGSEEEADREPAPDPLTLAA